MSLLDCVCVACLLMYVCLCVFAHVFRYLRVCLFGGLIARVFVNAFACALVCFFQCVAACVFTCLPDG